MGSAGTLMAPLTPGHFPLRPSSQTRVSSVRIMLSGNFRSKSGKTYREKHQNLFWLLASLRKRKLLLLLLAWIDGTKWVGTRQAGYAHDGPFQPSDWFNHRDVQ